MFIYSSMINAQVTDIRNLQSKIIKFEKEKYKYNSLYGESLEMKSLYKGVVNLLEHTHQCTPIHTILKL